MERARKPAKAAKKMLSDQKRRVRTLEKSNAFSFPVWRCTHFSRKLFPYSTLCPKKEWTSVVMAPGTLLAMAR